MLDLQVGPASIGETPVDEEGFCLFVDRQIIREPDRRMIARDPKGGYVRGQVVSIHGRCNVAMAAAIITANSYNNNRADPRAHERTSSWLSFCGADINGNNKAGNNTKDTPKIHARS